MSLDAQIRALDDIRFTHEAGHAAVCLALNGRIEFVTGDKMSWVDDSLPPWEKIVVATAGGIAARMYGARWRSENRGMSASDKEIAMEQLGSLGLGTSYIARAEQQAKSLLFTLERPVRRIAEALRRTGEVSGADAERLFRGESVDDVLASPTPVQITNTRLVTSTTRQSEYAVAPGTDIPCDAWPLAPSNGGGWTASCASDIGPPGLKLSNLEGEGATEAAAIESLRVKVARQLCSVAFTLRRADRAAARR